MIWRGQLGWDTIRSLWDKILKSIYIVIRVNKKVINDNFDKFSFSW